MKHTTNIMYTLALMRDFCSFFNKKGVEILILPNLIILFNILCCISKCN